MIKKIDNGYLLDISLGIDPKNKEEKELKLVQNQYFI